MGVIRTVLGDVDPATVGRVMPHEHLQSLTPGRWLSGGTADVEAPTAVGALAGLKERGFDLVADLSPYGVVGRSADGAGLEVLADISRQAGVHIVAGTAVYLEPYSPTWTLQADLDTLVARFCADATRGIGPSGVRAGVLGEQATGLGEITDHEAKCLRAAAIAHRETGLGLMTHTTHGTMALEQVDILRSEGADLTRVVVGHMDIQPEPAYVRAVLDTGVCIAFDTIGKQFWDFVLAPMPADPPEGEYAKRAYYRSDASRADLAAALVAEGYASQLFLAQDLTGVEVYLNPATHGQWAYSYLGEVFLPMLRERGVGEGDIETMVRDNPLRVLTLDAVASDDPPRATLEA